MLRQLATTVRLLAALFVGALLPFSAAAQHDDPLPLTASRWMLGGTVMVPRAGGFTDGSLTALGLSPGTLRATRLGADLAFVLLPRAIAAGVFVGAIRTNLALPIAVGRNALLIPAGGVTLVGGLGLGGVGGTIGLNGTMALVVFDRPVADPGPSYGLRVAVAQHRFGTYDSGALEMLEVGFVRRAR